MLHAPALQKFGRRSETRAESLLDLFGDVADRRVGQAPIVVAEEDRISNSRARSTRGRSVQSPHLDSTVSTPTAALTDSTNPKRYRTPRASLPLYRPSTSEQTSESRRTPLAFDPVGPSTTTAGSPRTERVTKLKIGAGYRLERVAAASKPS
ncbi:hypothetical protein JCM10212_001141 [Sporobolomyces blumeae]